jgi:hypothetical protein
LLLLIMPITLNDVRFEGRADIALTVEASQTSALDQHWKQCAGLLGGKRAPQG